MLIRKLFRTAWKYKSQFISMIIMVAIGAGVFIGFNVEWYSIERNANSFFEATNYPDYRIYNETGFSKEDIEAIDKINGVDEVSRALNVNVGVKDSENSLSLFVLEDYNISKLLITEGKEYSSDSDGFWLSDKYANANDISVGDDLTITYRGIEINGKVEGLAKSSEFMICVADENQLMPDYEVFGFVYASADKIFDALKMEFYPQINISSELTKNELEDELKSALGTTTLVLSKDEHVSYAGAKSEIEEGQTMGSILPVLFLAIAMLTMVTTMHRITANEKIQIGTLKALGFRDRKILRHYTSYGFVIGIVGVGSGIILGFSIAGLIINPDGMMGTYLDMPEWNLYMPSSCWGVAACMVIFLTFISFLSVKKMLKGTAADALRPYVPKKMKAMKIESTVFWKKLSFSVKWNLRDILRHKSRSLMTLLGIIGCMLLMVGGLGMKDTMSGFLELIDSEINNYKTKVNIVEDADKQQVLDFVNEQNADWQSSMSIKLEVSNDKNNGDKNSSEKESSDKKGDSKAVTLDIYDVNHDKIRFIDKSDNRVELTDDGAYICLRLADDINIGDEITFSPYGEEETYTVKVAGVIRSVMTENITMTKEYAESVGIPYHISSVYTDTDQNDIADADYISGKQSKQSIMESYDSFMEIMNIMVAVFVIAAIVLGAIVLYNLGVMSYLERSRELATLKVVGFRDKHIAKILISQNIWLTVLGVIIGLPAGFGVLYALIIALATEYELKLMVGVLTYSVSILLTFGVSLIVGLFVARKNKKIDMVEALKGAE